MKLNIYWHSNLQYLLSKSSVDFSQGDIRLKHVLLFRSSNGKVTIFVPEQISYGNHKNSTVEFPPLVIAVSGIFKMNHHFYSRQEYSRCYFCTLTCKVYSDPKIWLQYNFKYRFMLCYRTKHIINRKSSDWNSAGIASHYVGFDCVSFLGRISNGNPGS